MHMAIQHERTKTSGSRKPAFPIAYLILLALLLMGLSPSADMAFADNVATDSAAAEETGEDAAEGDTSGGGATNGSTEEDATSADGEKDSGDNAADENSADDSTAISGNNLVVHFLDVGQGDSTFIELPNGKTMLIDASTEEYGSTIADYIEDLGYSTIDYVVATHPHADHIGGMPKVLSSFEVGEVWAPDVDTTTKVYENFLDAVEEAGLSIDTAVAGATIATDGDLSVKIIGPASDCSSSDLNDWSAVVLITYGDTSFLFCGDAAAEDLYNWTDGEVDVLKVAHHGSYTGTTDSLAKKLSPEIAVISYGTDNSYGHPYQSVLDALENVDAKIYGTAVNGTVVVTSDGSTVEAECEREGTVVAGGASDSASSDDDSDGSDSSSSSIATITRLFGGDRYATMQAIVSEAYEGETCDYVVVVSGADFPDALSAASLAGALDAPILLVSSTDASAAVATMAKIEPEDGFEGVYVVGGASSVPDSVARKVLSETDLESYTRVYGPDRQETSRAVARKVLELAGDATPTTAIIASGTSFADALSASPYSYTYSAPIYLADNDGTVSDEVLGAVEDAGYDQVLIVGGPSSVSSKADAALAEIVGSSNVERFNGSNRYATSAMFAEWCVEEAGMTFDGCAFATGQSYPDALAGASLCGRNGSVLLLANGSEVAGISAGDPSESWYSCFADSAETVSQVYLLGGKNSVTSSTVDAIEDVLFDDVVYITASGSKYHSTASCSGLSSAKAVYETTLAEALEDGYEPCKICW